MEKTYYPDRDGGGSKDLCSADRRSCRICGNFMGNQSFIVREMMLGTRDQFYYFQCSKCGCLQILDIPADMSKYYPAGYYSFAEAHGPIASLKERALFLRDRFAYSGRGILGRVVFGFSPNPAMMHVRNLGLPLDARVLDVGSGDGKVIRVLARYGYARLTGIDPYLPGEENYGPHVKVWKRSMEELHGEFDLVMLHHSLEHMSDQRLAFSSISRLLAPRGISLIRVPTISSYAWERYGIHWVGLDAPRHFFLHSIQSLRTLANEANLKIKSIIWDSTPLQFWASDQYERGIPLNSRDSLLQNPVKLILRYGEIKEMKKRAAILNKEERGDQIALLLAKES
jgi:SAM-dependent methyltransferase